MEGETFEDFRRNVAGSTGDLLFGEGHGNEDVHIEIVAQGAQENEKWLSAKK